MIVNATRSLNTLGLVGVAFWNVRTSNVSAGQASPRR
jgi:hypothetical protein